MEDYLKGIGMGVFAAGAINHSAEAQNLAPAGTDLGQKTVAEQAVSPKMDWAKDILSKLDSMGTHDVRDIYQTMEIEKSILNVIKMHLNQGKGTYTQLDYQTLYAYYKKINARFALLEQDFEEKYAPDGDPERGMMLAELERLSGLPTGSAEKNTALYPSGQMLHNRDLDQESL